MASRIQFWSQNWSSARPCTKQPWNDIQRWQFDDASRGPEIGADIEWIMAAPEPVDVAFSSEAIDVPEGVAKLIRGRVTLSDDGLFAFALRLRDVENETSVITSDPIVGQINRFSVVSRWS